MFVCAHALVIGSRNDFFLVVFAALPVRLADAVGGNGRADNSGMTAGDQPRGLLTVRQVARRLAVSEPTTRRLIRAGLLPAVRVGRGIRVDEAELEDYIYGPGQDAA